MTQITYITMCLTFMLLGQICFSQKQNPKSIIEKYRWEGSCNGNSIYFKKLILEIYSDSTYKFKPIGCPNSYPNKKLKRQQKHWAAYGTYKVINGKRIFYQNNGEIGLKQHEKYITYNDTIVLKLQ